MQYFLILFLFLFLFSCKEKLPNLNPYNEFLKISSEKICKKMIKCNQNFIRTFSDEEIKNISVESCQNKILQNFDEKLKYQTEEMKLLSKSCYEKILEIDCKSFMFVTFTELSCVNLNLLSEKSYKEP